jgi:hypothetical protein
MKKEPRDLPPVVRSVYENQEDILRAILRLHCPDGFDADLTYGNGSFWKRLPRPRLCFDITPLAEGVIEADSRLLPLEPATLGNVVFDPPFLTYVKNGRDHKAGAVQMTKRFGGFYKYEELEDYYRDTISECYRVMKPHAKLVFKCQDIIHNHKMHCTHFRTILMAEAEGFRLADLFVLVARHRMPGPQKGTQRHARVWHSYFLVFERDGKSYTANPDVSGSRTASQKGIES